MHSFKKVVKIIAGQSFRLYKNSFRVFRERNIILTYHRITNEHLDGIYESPMFVTPSTFEMHLKEIRNYFDVVPLDAIMNVENIEKKLCAITFDDGWRDNYNNAFPILKKYGIPATIFLTVNMIGTRKKFWFQQIWELANKSIELGKEKEFVQYFSNSIPSSMLDSVKETEICRLISELKGLSVNEVEGLIGKAYGKIGVANETSRDLLDWEQVKEMGRHGIAFGSHGLNHYILPHINNDLKKREIFYSQKYLREKGANISPYFCYPNGNWDNASLALISEAGYRGAVTTRLGYNQTGSNPFLLNRIPIHEQISNLPSLFWFRIFQAMVGHSGL